MNNFIISLSQVERAERAAVSVKFQSQADAVFASGDEVVSERVELGRMAVTDAYKALQVARKVAAKAGKERMNGPGQPWPARW